MNKFLIYFKASEHGSAYLMRFISAWLCALVVMPLFSTVKVFDKEYAGNISIPILIIFFLIFLAIFTLMRAVKPLKNQKTDAAVLLASITVFAVTQALMYFDDNGKNTVIFLGFAPFLALAV